MQTGDRPVYNTRFDANLEHKTHSARKETMIKRGKILQFNLLPEDLSPKRQKPENTFKEIDASASILQYE